MSTNIVIRAEQPADCAAIRRVLLRAFPTEQEAHLVDRLRQNGNLMISLVAESAGKIVGQIAFSAVTVCGAHANGQGVGLAPLAVLPEWQRRGVGGRLIRAGVTACAHEGIPLIVLLGEPEYYRRFGFLNASSFGLANEYGVDDAFMALPLFPQAVVDGLVRYAPEFNEFKISQAQRLGP